MPDAEVVETTTDATSNTSAEAPEEAVDAEQSEQTEDFRSKWEAQRKVSRDLEKKLKALQKEQEALADKDKSPDEQAVEAAKREGREEAESAYNQRLINAELKAALAGKVNNLALAMKVIDPSEIDFDTNGEVDVQSVTDTIEAALAQYPELVPTNPQRFNGTADQGTKDKTTKPRQLTREDMKLMSPDEIAAADAKGQFATLKGR